MKVFINNCLKQVFLHPDESKIFTGQVAKWQLHLGSDSTEYIVEIGSLSQELTDWLKNRNDHRPRHLAIRVAPLPNGSRLKIKWEFTKTLEETLGDVIDYYSVLDLYGVFDCPKGFLKGSTIETIQVLRNSEGFRSLNFEGIKFLKAYLSDTLSEEVVWRKISEAPDCVLSLHGSGSLTIPAGFKGTVLLDSNFCVSLDRMLDAKCFVSTNSGKVISLEAIQGIESGKTLRKIIKERYSEKFNGRNLSDEKFLQAVSLLQEVGE